MRPRNSWILLPALLGAYLGAGEGAAAKVERLAKEGHWLEQAWEQHRAMLNKPAPKLEFSDWMNGPVGPEAMKGKIVVVDFWATWCGPCRRSIPHNNELAAKYAAMGVLVIGACGGGGEEKMGEVVKATALAYPTAKVKASITAAWGVQWWPTYAVVDRRGNLRALGLQPDYVEKVVEALLEEPPGR